MRTPKLCSAVTFLLLGLLTLAQGRFSLLFAQEESGEARPPQASKEECLSTFNINEVNFKDSKIINSIPLLAEYFQCKAAARDTMDECGNLNPWSDRVNVCRKNFNEYHGLWGRLFKEGRVTPQVLSVWVNVLGKDAKEGESFMQGMLNGDISFCENLPPSIKFKNECKAMISANIALCSGDTVCKAKTTYIKALKTGDIKECDKIEGPFAGTVRSMCRGDISTDENMCENNEGFREFRNNYCR